MIKFVIPFRLPSLNEYTAACRSNKYAGAKYKKQIEDSIMWVLNLIPTKITSPVVIIFTWYEQHQRRDKDNVCFAKKFILDALQKSDILPNDNNQFIEGFYDQFVYGQGSKVVVEIKSTLKIDQKEIKK